MQLNKPTSAQVFCLPAVTEASPSATTGIAGRPLIENCNPSSAAGELPEIETESVTGMPATTEEGPEMVSHGWAQSAQQNSRGPTVRTIQVATSVRLDMPNFFMR